MMTARAAKITATTQPITDSEEIKMVELPLIWFLFTASLCVGSFFNDLLVILSLVVGFSVVVRTGKQIYTKWQSTYLCGQRTQFAIANLWHWLAPYIPRTAFPPENERNTHRFQLLIEWSDHKRGCHPPRGPQCNVTSCRSGWEMSSCYNVKYNQMTYSHEIWQLPLLPWQMDKRVFCFQTLHMLSHHPDRTCTHFFQWQLRQVPLLRSMGIPG